MRLREMGEPVVGDHADDIGDGARPPDAGTHRSDSSCGHTKIPSSPHTRGSSCRRCRGSELESGPAAAVAVVACETPRPFEPEVPAEASVSSAVMSGEGAESASAGVIHELADPSGGETDSRSCFAATESFVERVEEAPGEAATDVSRLDRCGQIEAEQHDHGLDVRQSRFRTRPAPLVPPMTCAGRRAGSRGSRGRPSPCATGPDNRIC